MELHITSGKLTSPQKVVIYGSEGIGKSSLCTHFPDPLFIDTEAGSKRLDIRRTQSPQTWQELLDIIKAVAAEDICKTLVIDTADWAEKLAIADILAKYKKNGIEDFGYGKGYTYIGEAVEELLNICTLVLNSGKHVVFTAHAKMRKFEQPDEAGAYDRWEMKLTKQSAPLLKEWADLLLFLNYKTYVVESETGTNKAQGGKRVMYTTHNPCWDAKNRDDLADELPLDYAAIGHLFSDNFGKKTEEKTQKEAKVDETAKENKKKHPIYDILANAGIALGEFNAYLSDKKQEPINLRTDAENDELVKYQKGIIKDFKKWKETMTNG